jgi:hypothetical protein
MARAAVHNEAAEYVFSWTAATPAVAAIRPALEVVISVRLGDDPGPGQALWQALARSQPQPLPYVVDDRLGLGAPRPATDEERDAIVDALECACIGPREGRRIDWSGMQFQDTAHVDEIPSRTCACSVGSIRSRLDARGICLRATYPFSHRWSDSVVLARELAAGWPDLISWIGLGYRFVPVSIHSAAFEAATEVIRNRSRRFLAVDVGDLFGLHSSVWQSQVRTPLWTMVLSSRILQRIGGTAHVLRQCEGSLRCEPLRGSLFVQAGDVPLCGDVNRREDVRPYRMLDRLLAPLRAAGGVLLLPPWDEDASIAWLQRFQQTVDVGEPSEATSFGSF